MALSFVNKESNPKKASNAGHLQLADVLVDIKMNPWICNILTYVKLRQHPSYKLGTKTQIHLCLAGLDARRSLTYGVDFLLDHHRSCSWA